MLANSARSKRGAVWTAWAGALLATLALLAGCSPAPDDLATIVERNTEAMGGAAAIEATQSVEYRVRITEPKFTVEGVYVADRRGQMRIDVYAGGKRVFTEAYDGTAGWQMRADGKAAPSSPAGTAALRHGTQFPGKLLGLHEMKTHGHRLRAAGRETLDGRDYDVLALTLSDGFTTYLYVDRDNWLIERQRDVRALHPDLDPDKKVLEDRMSDFRPVDGVMRSFAQSQVDARTGATLQTTEVESIRVNVPIDPKLFESGAPPPDRAVPAPAATAPGAADHAGGDA